MKKILIAVVMCMVAASAGAQIRFGAKAGLSILSADVRSVQDGVSKVKSKDAGFTVGLTSRIGILGNGVFVQPELMFNHAKYGITDAGGASRSVNYNNLELPVMLGGKFLFFDMYAGPVFNLTTFGDSSLEIYRPDVGYQLGLGLGLFRFVQFDVRYQGYFSKKFDKFVIDTHTDHLKVTDGMWVMTVGHFF